MNNSIIIDADVRDIMAYVLLHNGLKIINELKIINNSEDILNNLLLKISSDNDLIIPFEEGIQQINSQEVYSINTLNVQMNGAYLASLSERMVCTLKIELYKQDNMIVAKNYSITVLAYDEWPGTQYTPELLAAFVTPNNSVITELLRSTSHWMEKWTGVPSLEGYQADINRVKYMIGAGYAAIQEKNITYANPPASFEELGQRIRLVDMVIQQGFGTCMDMTLLYASLLEAIGLNTILVLCKGHIFIGVWLIDQSFSQPLVDDPTQLEKRYAHGINELIVVECTAMCSGHTVDFETAVKDAKEQMSDYSKFEFAIDVLRARRSGIRPLPSRIKSENGYVLDYKERDEKDITDKPEDIEMVYDLSHLSKDEVTKQTQWERKLLDLSLRNMLINLRLTKAIIPLLSANIGDLENALADGEEFVISSKPMEWNIMNVDVFNPENTNDLGPYKDLIALECKHHRLPSLYSEKELNITLTKMYRSAKTSMEENGASTLYLSLGLLRWIDKESTTRYAPIILIPIDIIRKSARKGYALKMRDEDAQVNITLLEFLKQTFDINIAGLSPAPYDEHGLDVDKIFAIIRHAIMDEKLWDIVESAFIGNFSFNQFVMWNDVHNNEAFLRGSKIVNGLMNGAVDWDCHIPEMVDSDEAYCPVSVDGSQLRAVNMAANEVSFVLHGPPGTGKSQTITAMISNALVKGKKILFVAEKMAALQVVQKRLASLGISDFCLELHSNKATKKSVLNQLERVLEISTLVSHTQYDHKIKEIRAMKQSIDTYVTSLHQVRPFGCSLRDLINKYEDTPDLKKEVIINKEYLTCFDETKLNKQIHILESLIASAKAIGHPYNHPLQCIGQTLYSQTLKENIEVLLPKYKDILDILSNDMKHFNDMLHINIMTHSLDEYKQVLESIKEYENIPGFLKTSTTIEADFINALEYLEIKESFHKKKQVMLKRWDENFLALDMSYYQRRLAEANKKFFGKAKALSTLTSEIQTFAKFNVNTDDIPKLLIEVNNYQKEKSIEERKRLSLDNEWKVIINKFNNIGECKNYKNNIINTINHIHKLIPDIDSINNKDELLNTIDQFNDDMNQYILIHNQVDDLLKLTYHDNDNWIEEEINRCDLILSHVDDMKDWIIYKQLYQQAIDIGLEAICHEYENGMDHDEVIDVYYKSIYKSLILNIIENDQVLNNFTGATFNEQIAQFKQLDKEFMELTKDEMYYQLVNQLPQNHESIQISKELNILRRAIKSNGRGMTIRTLFDQIPTVLKRLCPCMLMSPISVAQYMACENDLFDIVVFDEASQIPTCKAVGVLARGKNAVIVGDPNQMPPTSFFAGNTIDEDNLDIEDLDSILDDCLALGMPSTHLKWHYRSRHESLIAFSNKEFYENKMYTFPSVNDRERKVNLVHVEGYFERGKGRINKAEAQAIVNEIKRRYIDEDLNKQTLGVVTFNINQQTYIEDLLQEEFSKDSKFDAWANSGEEPLFVKNLENVQGDERDIILFSVAFGPDNDGKMLMNFGPLNKDGGWKRLNVAVSRARCEMVVFTIMTPEMIDLRRTKSKGVESLKNFLEYADKGMIYEKHTIHQKNDGILNSICKELENNGYEVQTAIGHSDFKIDIAIVNPYNKDEYILGIMLDGDSYKQTTNTKDREVSQLSVLNNLGWYVVRIWTLDWWDNKQKEITKLLNILSKRVSEAQAKSETIIEEKAAIEVIKDDKQEYASLTSSSNEVNEYKTYTLLEYQFADIQVDNLSPSDYVLDSSLPMIKDVLSCIIESEAPISYDVLIKRTLQYFGIKRTSNNTIEMTEKVMKRLKVRSIKQQGIRYVWTKEQDPKTYNLYRVITDSKNKRTPDDICQQEIKNAICITLQNTGPLSKEQLIKETVKTMGYAHSGSALVNAIERGLKFGRRTGEIVINEDKKYTLS